MKKLMVAVALMITSAAAFAQHAVGSFNIQPKVGLNVANLSKLKIDSRLGLAAGLEGEYQVSDLFSISAGALYSMQGAKSGSTTYKLDYINVPIMANVYVVKGLAVKLGVQPGFKVSEKLSNKTIGDFNNPLGTTNSFDLSIPVGVSYEYANVQLDARYNLGVTNVFKGISDVKNSVFQITLGYKFDL